jgi:hypothetical protein
MQQHRPFIKQLIKLHDGSILLAGALEGSSQGRLTNVYEARRCNM